MKKLNRKDYLYILLTLIIPIGFIIYLLCKGYIFGSEIDWANQHIVIPEYFRSMFYKTGHLIPHLALNLGMGQNIFYFTYYGLLSPIILLSYLLPFIPMYIYMLLAVFLSITASSILFYKWINNKYNSEIALISTLMLILNSTYIYQCHRHIMFVIYMPFMLLALRSVDLYIEKKKPIPLIISSLLLILTNYYFSFSGIIIIGIYTIYKILESKKESFKSLFKIMYYVTISILLSAIIILPTIYALSRGRISTNVSESINYLKLLIPFSNFNKTFLNSYYSWGVTSIYIISIVNLFLSKKKSNTFLAIIMSLFMFIPASSYLLNGLMYVDGKCFIPFLPVAILTVANLLNQIAKKEINIKKTIIYSLILSLFIILGALKVNTLPLLLIDLVLVTIALYLSNKYPKLIYIPIILITIATASISSYNEHYLKISDIKNINDQAYYNLTNIKDNTLYRTSILDNTIYTPNKTYNGYRSSIYSSTSNKYYLKFMREYFQIEEINRDNTTLTDTPNVLFDIYSGTKYIVSSSDNVPIGYTKIKSENNINLYQNENILPIAYASNKVMSQREFENLTYPETLDALLNYVIVDESLENVYKNKTIKKYTGKYQINKINNLEYSKKDGHYIIKAGKKANAEIELKTPIKNQILIIKFNMNKAKSGYACSSNITINGVTNALSCDKWKYNNNNNTFEYVLSSNEPLKTINIEFTNDKFDISDLEFYTIDYNTIKNLNTNIDELVIDQEKLTDSYISGTINVQNDGYLKITLPYEKKGYKIYIDGEKADLVKTDTAFIGAKITQGTHKVEITYNPPLFKTGKYLSLLGLVLFIPIIFYNKYKKQYQKIGNKIKSCIKKLNLNIKKFVKNNKGYLLLGASLFILDLSLRLFYSNQINYYHWFNPMPNIFSLVWIIFILTLTKNIKGIIGKIIYFVFYIFSIIMFLVHSIYFSYFKEFFDYSVMQVAGEGTDYLSTVLLNIPLWIIIIFLASITLTVLGIKKIDQVKKTNGLKVFLIIIIFIALKFILPFGFGPQRKNVEWDDWRNSRSVYTSYNDNNKSLMVSGMFEYNVRNFYINFMQDNTKLSKQEEEVLNDNFKDLKQSETNKYTGIFKDKNLIIVQLESVDDFLLDKNIMPTFYKLSRNSINFTKHFSYTSGGGSTFNSEFMVNTGYSSAYNYNQSAYTFSRNTYAYSLANLFKKQGYEVNAFHMNSSEYYSRGINYKAFGYDSYNGLKDLGIYENNEFWLDTELIKNETFNEKIFNPNKKTLSYIITYSAHMPYKTTKGTCPMLTDKQGLTEYECLKIQAKETDDMLNLILENLKEKNMMENTVLVLFTDHYVYTLENKSLLDEYKETDTNLINKTPFMIYHNGEIKKTVKNVNSQLDILPTILNLFGITYYPNNYIGRDILSNDYDPLVFFPDGSWYNGQTYVTNGEYYKGRKISDEKLQKYNSIVKRKMSLNDAVIKSDYFAKKTS